MANVGTSLLQYDSSKSTNDNYRVRIKCGALNVEILADMPEETQTAVGSEWEGLLPASIGGLLGEGIEFASKAIGGSGMVLQENSQQIWVNSSPMEIPLTLQFDAELDAYTDVYAPMRMIELMALPDSGTKYGLGGTWLFSPGTNRGTVMGGDSTISLSIGRYLTIPRVIIVNVSSSFSSRLDARGFPIHGKSDITFRTDRVLSRSDWRGMVRL